MKTPLPLRPHHGLCIQKFTGQGYDQAFTQHMAATVRHLQGEPCQEIRLVSCCDQLCSHCPNNCQGICRSSEKVASLDQAVLEVCGYSPEKILSWQDFARDAREKILLTDGFLHICAKCQWFSLCQNTRIGSYI